MNDKSDVITGQASRSFYSRRIDIKTDDDDEEEEVEDNDDELFYCLQTLTVRKENRRLVAEKTRLNLADVGECFSSMGTGL